MSKDDYGFVKMRKIQAISVCFILVVVALCCTVLTEPMIMGVSASQWVLAAISAGFPIFHIVRMHIARSKGKEGL